MSRLVLVVPAFPQASETFIASKVGGLLQRGWDVHVLCRQTLRQNVGLFADPVARLFAEGRVHLEPRLERTATGAARAAVAVTGALMRAPLRTVRHWRTAAHGAAGTSMSTAILDSALAPLAPSLVHFEFGALALGRTTSLTAAGIPYSVSFRGYDVNFHRLEEGAVYADVCRTARAVHVLGEDLKRRVIARGCPPDAHFAVIPPAIDVDFFDPALVAAPARSGTRRLRILSVGRLEWKKGYEHAVESVRLLVRRGWDVEYRIVGDGGHALAISVAVAQAGLQDRITLLGRLSREQIRRELREADLFLHAAVSEGFCNAVLEAQAMQCVPVVTDAGGLPENVLHEETGLVVNKYSATALADAMERLLEDSAFRTQLAQRGRERVRETFKLEQQLDRWEAFYRGLGLQRGAP